MYVLNYSVVNSFAPPAFQLFLERCPAPRIGSIVSVSLRWSLQARSGRNEWRSNKIWQMEKISTLFANTK